MARKRNGSQGRRFPFRRAFVGALLACLVALFAFWRVDSPRAERFRADVIDRVVSGYEWVLIPVTRAAALVEDFQSYQKIHAQNQELRRELRQMKAWKEAALQLEQQNAKLLHLNHVRIDPKLTYVTGIVLADSGSPFRRSVLVNIGARDGIVDGWAATDGHGLVGRISGVGRSTSRVILVTDSNSRVPVEIQPSGQASILAGDNSNLPALDFIENPELVRPGDRIVSSGDGGVFPAGLLVGTVVQSRDGSLRAQLAADHRRLDYLRVFRARRRDAPADPGGLVVDPGAPSPGGGTPGLFVQEDAGGG